MNKLFAKIGVGVMVLSIFGVTTFTSCKKEAPTIAKIRVVDTSGAPFGGAMVRLYPTPSIVEHGAIIIDDTLMSDADGIATFDYTDHFNLGQAGFTVLDIEVRSGDSLYGQGIIKIEEEKVNEETVILQP
ncbi:hypothetical protein K6119_12215 [Paracrocinitomix mangrovi]|uniref:hypothetical protein n=1 Tax=Paracrocinitomix mangrovi TaxID=2862509 RepID=UPI001C8E6048|nr:hypothetical protein [Paracrocinitomix mangrovi]UKN00496.1 hypothetical protein K6119_12215 [Paracrocinitomix mangrovi]